MQNTKQLREWFSLIGPLMQATWFYQEYARHLIEIVLCPNYFEVPLYLITVIFIINRQKDTSTEKSTERFFLMCAQLVYAE